MPIDAEQRMRAAEERGSASRALEIAKESIVAAAIGSCDCNTKSADPIFHQAYCRWLKLLTALDNLDTVAEHIKSS